MQSYLCLQLIRLKRPDTWAHSGDQLAFVFPRGGTGTLTTSNPDAALAVGDVLVLKGAPGVLIAPVGNGDFTFSFFSLHLEHLFPLLGTPEIARLQAVSELFKCPRVYAGPTPTAIECHKLLDQVPPRFGLDHRGQLLRVAATILATEFKNLRATRDGATAVEDHVTTTFEKLSITEILDLSVGELAQRFSCSRRHLNRLFHQYFGLSVAALRMEMRLLKAATLLRDPSAKVINVAEDCGFNHLGLFNTCFKRRFGTTPSAWRKSPEQEQTKNERPPVGDPACRLQANGLCPWVAKTVAPPDYPSPGHTAKPSSQTASLQKGAAGKAASLSVLAACYLCSASLPAQDYRSSMSSDAALEAHAAQVESRPYTYKTGDFRLLLAPQLGFDYNDNISVSGGEQKDDFILRPALAITGSYPIGKRNLLTINATIGYDQYLQNTEYSYFRLDSGSVVSFDVFVKEFMFNFHDRFSYTHDPGMQASVANAPQYGGFDNTVGVSVSRDFNDFIPTLGFDHINYISSDEQYSYMDRNTEALSARAGYVFLPTLTAGLEASGTLTRYSEPYLNDNTGVSGGVYSDYRPSKYLGFTTRAGYSAYFFDQTSRVMPAVDQDAWYFDLSINHAPLEAISYSLSGGHELSLGQQADAVETWYCRANFNWHIINHLTLGTSLSYENGTQGEGQAAGRGISETYNMYSAGISMGHEITKKLRASLNYRFSYRTSDAASREYNQNLVGLLLTYSLQ